MAAALACWIARTAVAQRGTRDPIADEADSVARVAGYAVPLRSAPIATGDLEIRAYIGFGIMIPENFIRIRRHADEVTGALVLGWPGTTPRFDVPDDPERPIAQHDQEVWTAAMRNRAKEFGCSDAVRGGWVETCVVEPKRPVDWTSALAELRSGGILTLPQQPSRLGLDGTTLYVEIRDGSKYRAYSYWTPDEKSGDANDRAAARVMDRLLRLFD
ncbi:MAG TPA: hypothetical protein VN706_24145 [Gemmatimonadaceae bacterium]|nr:hypothetical protein [Gemmatimonadaceae bacterium]